MAAEEDVLRRLIATEAYFIASRHYDNDLRKLEERYPEGCPDHIAAHALLMTEEELTARFEKITQAIREEMRVQVDVI